jgi:xanthine dehydrogenase YagR molybdenum-binding subunit
MIRALGTICRGASVSGAMDVWTCCSSRSLATRSRWLGSFDCGRILNPKTATSQFRGGIIMGIGMALTEETLFDERRGRIMNPSLAEYHVPVHLDVPHIEIIYNDIADEHAPLGAHGVGEIGITGAAAAVANAVFHATGRRIRDLPITLDKLL